MNLTRALEQPPPLPMDDADPPTNPGTRREERREARMERRPGRKGYVPLARKGGVRLKASAAFGAAILVWWPLMWGIGMPLEYATAGLTAITVALGGLLAGDTVRPMGSGKAEDS